MNKKAICCICICFCIGLGIFAERFEYAIPADSGLCTVLVVYPYCSASENLKNCSEYYFRYNPNKSMRKYGKCSQFGKSSEIDADIELIAKTIVSHYEELLYSQSFPNDYYRHEETRYDEKGNIVEGFYKALCDWQEKNCPELYTDEFKDKKYKIVIEVEDEEVSPLDCLFVTADKIEQSKLPADIDSGYDGIKYNEVEYYKPKRDGFVCSYPYLVNPTAEQQSKYESYLEEQKSYDGVKALLKEEMAEIERKKQERQEKLSVYEKVSNAKILSIPGKFSVGQKLKFTCNNVSYQTRNNSCLCFFDDYNIESLSFACSNEAIDSILEFEDAKKGIFGSLVWGCSVYGHINSDGKFIIEFVE